MVDLELDLDFENVCVIFFSIANQSLDDLELDLAFENVCVFFSTANQSLDDLELDLDFENVCGIFSSTANQSRRRTQVDRPDVCQLERPDRNGAHAVGHRC